MSLSRKQIEKRKQRDKDVRKKVLERRTEIRTERKLVEEERSKEREMYEIEHGKVRPALPGNPELAQKVLAERESKVAEKLRKNIEILKHLENEYEKEQASRNNLNQPLESEGHMTMKEKMDALHEKALKMQRVADDLDEAAKSRVQDA